MLINFNNMYVLTQAPDWYTSTILHSTRRRIQCQNRWSQETNLYI